MKKSLLVFFGLLLFSSAAYAISPDTSYVALYADSGRTITRVDYTGATTRFEMYICWLPSGRGIHALEFKMNYPSNMIAATVTESPDISVSLGTITSGASVGLTFCKTDWFWSHHQTCYLTSSAAGFIYVGPHPQAGGPQISTCDLGYPIEPIRRWHNLCLNSTCQLAVGGKTWGAIKELYR